MSPPPTALTLEEQATYKQAKEYWRLEILSDVSGPIVRELLAIIRRLDKIVTSYEVRTEQREMDVATLEGLIKAFLQDARTEQREQDAAIVDEASRRYRAQSPTLASGYAAFDVLAAAIRGARGGEK